MLKRLIGILFLVALTGCKTTEIVYLPRYTPVEVKVPVYTPPDTLHVVSPPTNSLAKVDSASTPQEYVNAVNEALLQYVLWSQMIVRLGPALNLKFYEADTARVNYALYERLRYLPSPDQGSN